MLVSVFALSRLCPCVSQASTCLLCGWTYCKLSVFPFNPWPLLSWDLLAFGRALAMVEQTYSTSAAPVHERGGCLMSSSALPGPFFPFYPVLCSRNLTCVDCINNQKPSASITRSPQLLVRFGSGSSGGRWKGERRMKPRHSFLWLSPCVFMVCWLSFSTEGVSSCQLYTALSLDSSV